MSQMTNDNAAMPVYTFCTIITSEVKKTELHSMKNTESCICKEVQNNPKP
jgi:hypothetical protein